MTKKQLLDNRYELRSQVGKGATGAVWNAYDTLLRRIVAIKLVELEGSRDPEMSERFRREGIAIAGINHPGIVRVYDAGTDATRGWLVMDLLNGPNLTQLVNAHGPLPHRVGVPLLAKVASALQAAHDAGITHRDVKPANIVLNHPRDVDLYAHPELGQPTLVDFGIARIVDEAGRQLTRPATAIGTAAYMSPEQARGQQVGSESDVYSLGCVAYYLLSSRPPFEAESSVAVAHAQAFDKPEPLIDRVEDIPPALDAFVARMLAKDPANRPSAREVADEFTAIVADPSRPADYMDQATISMPAHATVTDENALVDPYEPVPPPEGRRPVSKSRIAMRIFIGVLFAVLVAALVWSWSRPYDAQPASTITMTHTTTATQDSARTRIITEEPVADQDSYSYTQPYFPEDSYATAGIPEIPEVNVDQPSVAPSTSAPAAVASADAEPENDSSGSAPAQPESTP